MGEFWFNAHSKNLVFGVIGLILGGITALIGLIVPEVQTTGKYLVIFGVGWSICALIGMFLSKN